MPESLKHLIHAGTVDAAAHHLARACPDFDARRFRRLASQGLEALEFKARARHVCSALEATLPSDFAASCDAIEAALAPVRGDEALSALYERDDGLSGWVVWPLSEYVARRGLDAPKRSLVALHAMTKRFSAEWALRPFIEHHPALTFETLTRWTRDPSEHVRRLVSEGSRPRLPWGQQLKSLIADPSPTLPLLERLQDDESEYVRRSVANHLNDIAKDHPDRVADWLERHLPDAPAPRRALLRHACRTLVKRGDRRVLEAFGLGRPFAGETVLKISPRRIGLGEAVTLSLVLRTRAKRAQTLVIDYAVHHVKANGETSPKVFKGWNVTLTPGETRTLAKRHAIKPITTRTYHPGRHLVDVRINGKVCAEGRFELEI
ncbi:MAG: DNA alkylation repair protein [Deltaproteobacteria bacterium]|nr:DNA alkylation repair protein [Deltaproteobacteria bacterium]